jgi:hypothetical protein
MKNKKSKAWLKEEAKLKAEAMILLKSSEILKLIAEENYRKMEAIDETKFDDMPWDEKERAITYFNSLLDKINQSAKDLASLDKIYAELRVRVNRFYGKDVMKEFKSDVPDLTDEENDDDPADWWRNIT